MSRRGRPRKSVKEPVETPVTVEARPVKSIALDVDGVLANTHGLILRHLGLPSDIEVITSWEFLQGYGEVFWDAYYRSWRNFEDIPPTDDSVRYTVEVLRSRGYRVAVVTNRDEALRPYTERWLARNGIRYDELVILPFDADKVGQTSYDIYVDDYPDLAVKYPDRVVIYDRPWNRAINGRRIKRLEDLLKVVP